jgi:hypothetical protein
MKEGICPQTDDQGTDKLYCDTFAEGNGCKWRKKCTLYKNLDHIQVKIVKKPLEVIK